MRSFQCERSGMASHRWGVLVLLAGLLVVGPACRSVAPAELERLMEPSELPAHVAAEAPALDVALLERAIHNEVNAVRAARGLPLLSWSDELALVTRAHSRDMAQRGYFGHVNLSGDDPTTRAVRAGIETASAEAAGVGENLFLTHRYDEYLVDRRAGELRYIIDWKLLDELARQAVEAWMHSPAHRANLLYPKYAAQAVGVELGPNQTVFVTQNLSCAPRLATHAARTP